MGLVQELGEAVLKLSGLQLAAAFVALVVGHFSSLFLTWEPHQLV